MRTNPVSSIPCLVLTHGRDDINQASLTSIIDCDPRLDVDVVHNPSATEDGSFIDFARACAADGKIRSFTLFDQNISNNAFFLFLLENLDRYTADRVVLSDGDILAPKSIIDEQTAILAAHSDVMACGLRLDARAWDDSLVIKENFVDRFNTSRFEHEDYLNTATGMWMTMFRGPELASIVRTLRDNGLRLTDTNLKQIGAALFQKQWVATKKSVGRELNRERPDYHDAKAVSTQAFNEHSPEPSGSKYATWNHDIVAPAIRWLGDQEEVVAYSPLPPAKPRFRGPLDDDPVVEQLKSGQLQHGRGYLAKHLVATSDPGLALIVCDRDCPTGLPALMSDRSALFISNRSEPGDQIATLAEMDLGPVFLGREASECRAILTTIRRFLGPGSLLHGILFSAEEVRRHFAEGQPPQASILPPNLHRLATIVAERRTIGDAADGAVDKFVDRLWSDEAVAAWINVGNGSLQLSKSVKNPHLAYFRVKL